jgi:hypothetical protein
MFTYLKTASISEPTPGMHMGEVTSNVELLVLGGLVSVTTTKVAVDLYAHRAGR